MGDSPGRGGTLCRVACTAEKPQVTEPRVEVKIPVPVAMLPAVRAWVRVHPAHFRQAFPRRWVNNLYFDTPTYWGLNANLGGLGERAKLRLRWYGACVGDLGEAQLEVKHKTGTAGWKEILYLRGDLALDLRHISWSRVLSRLRDAGSGTADRWLMASPVPVLINSYQRDYYVTADGVLRLTIDERLRAYDQRATACPNLNARSPIGESAVVELKASMGEAALRRLYYILADAPLPATRFSKYVQGVTATPDFG